MSTGLAPSDECSHDVVFKGLCVMCSKDVSGPAFGNSGAAATINMTVDGRILVSQKAAERLERETAERLHKERKLSLILDLDQTVIHATVDPTVGEWMNDTNNPSFPALTNVFQFVLPEAPTVYYIKLRPGTFEFLEKASKLYELHIYTMGTRNYAEAVARIIDPQRRLFNDRILSRDESGSFQEKKISRLFPGEGERMAVIVDDRGDVWGWCRNLIRIKPYDFFVGIGDINEPLGANGKAAANQLKQTGVLPATILPASSSSSETTTPEAQQEIKEDILALVATETAALTETPEVAAKHLQETLSQIQQHAIHRQEVSRPLKDRPVLHDNDTELEEIMRRLERIHREYFGMLDEEGDCDVRDVMDGLRKRVLRGCEVVLSGVVPVGFDQRRHDLYRFATIFGGNVAKEVGSNTIVAAKAGTDKVHKAVKQGGIHVVHPDWLYHTAIAWKRLPEESYRLVKEKSRPTSANASSTQTPMGSSADQSESLDDEVDEQVNIGGIDWSAMDAEIEAEMDSSDEDENEGEAVEKDDDDFDVWAEIEGAMGDLEEDEDSSDGGVDGEDGKKRKRSPSPFSSSKK
ncbi:Carboxy-terminal domain (CTD) phosphatase [Rhizoclosmatium sp. JEL0117]|nr:Carboxy-terminal domain (CTD) phosphatase [Rhizoclosmatium sp. JEL0117]